MKRKKGFTLIELLAVIVILAIIALIATPLVLKYIQTSRDNARLRSAENYLNAVEKAVVNQNMNGKKFNPNVCNVKDEKLYCDGILLDVSIKGVKPDNSSVITFNNGKIDRVKLLYDDKIIVDNEKDILVYGEDIEILPAGVYDDNNSLLASWDELVNKYGLDIEANYNNNTYKASGSMYAVLNNNPNLSSATKVIVKDEITKTGNFAFHNCQNLKKIILPNSIVSIGNLTFANNKLLKEINIPQNVINIGGLAFNGCDSLQSIDIPEGVTIIQMDTFSGCQNLSKVTISSKLTKIASSAFRGTSITNITIPDSVTTIGSDAFTGTNLSELKISKNVTSIGMSVCASCEKLEKVIVDKENPKYNDGNGSNVIVETATNKLLMGSKNAIIPDGIKIIDQRAFRGFDLKNINIPNSVTTINKFAFSYNDITNIIIPESVTTIGGEAFSFNKSLKEIRIPKSVTSMGNGITLGCESLDKIVVDEENTIYDSRDDSNAIIKTSTNELITGCNKTVIPNTVTSIGKYAFGSLPNLTSITIPNSVTTIATEAFGSTGLTDVIIPSSVTSIGDYAFCNTNLTDVTIPTSIKSIGSGILSNCPNLKNVTIPDSVTSIGSFALANCPSLTTITIPDSVTSIDEYAFSNSDNLKTIYYKGTATGAPWRATNATVISDY